MLKTYPNSAYLISIAIAVLATVAAAGGLLIDDLYRDNLLVRAAFRGNDLVTLGVAVPVLIVALILAFRGSQRAQLVWLGILAYTLFNYAFYVFGAVFNPFFLLYVALFTLALFALLFGLPHLDINGLSRRFRASPPVTWVSIYMLVWGVLQGGLWIGRSLGFVVTGQIPGDILQTGYPFATVYALDLSLLVPFLVLGAIWLWQRRTWGYVLGIILNVGGATYALALIAMSGFGLRAGVAGAGELIPVWAVLGVGSLVASLVLLGNLEPVQR